MAVIIVEQIKRIKNLISRKIPSDLYAKRYFKKYYDHSFDLNNPVTFNEKLWWLHIFNRDPLTTVCTDKVLVRDYVSECGLSHILNEVYSVYKHPNAIELSSLPNEFFLKCNHLSDGNIWCKEKAAFPIDDVKQKLNELFNQNYYWNSREWNYKNINPQIICEKVLKDPKSNVGLIDYRFFCFEGEVKFLAVDIETSNNDGSHNIGAKRNIYDVEFNKLEIRLARPNFDEELISKPKNFAAMIEYASVLSKPFSACRVDFYNIDGDIIFGEITFHQGGSHDIEPKEYQIKWGDYINLKSPKIVVEPKVRKKYLNTMEQDERD